LVIPELMFGWYHEMLKVLDDQSSVKMVFHDDLFNMMEYVDENFDESENDNYFKFITNPELDHLLPN